MPLNSQEYKTYYNSGITPDAYYSSFKIAAENPERYDHGSYIPLNWQRVNRILKTFKPDTPQCKAIQQFNSKHYLIAITEFWCGDAAQIIPVLSSIFKNHPSSFLKLHFRDVHTALIDAHLTGSSRSIPKLIFLNSNFEFQAEWGPRPKPAIDLVTALKSNAETAPHYAEHLHKWYAQDRQQSIVSEIYNIMQSID
jgi:hypothetical protein